VIHATDASTRGFPYFFVCVCVRPTPALPPSIGVSVRLPLATSPANSPPSVTPRSTLLSRRLHLCPQISSTPADSPARGYPTSLPRTSPGIMRHHLLCSLRLCPPTASIYVCDSTASLTRRPLLSQTSVCIPSSADAMCRGSLANVDDRHRLHRSCAHLCWSFVHFVWVVQCPD
jgi:hypothetical protein